MGTVVVLNNNNVVQKEIGKAGESIGEYIFISEDAPGGNVVVGISFSEGTNALDHVNLWMLPKSRPNDSVKYVEHAAHT